MQKTAASARNMGSLRWKSPWGGPGFHLACSGVPGWGAGGSRSREGLRRPLSLPQILVLLLTVVLDASHLSFLLQAGETSFCLKRL